MQKKYELLWYSDIELNQNQSYLTTSPAKSNSFVIVNLSDLVSAGFEVLKMSEVFDDVAGLEAVFERKVNML